MEFHSFSPFYPQYQVRNTHKTNFDDIPSFEEAFKTDDLRKFYQQSQQTQMVTCSDLYAKDDFMREDMSSTDDQETQASPLLTRYIQKFNQDMPISQSRLAINLSHQFYSDDTEMMTEPLFNNFQISRMPQESPITHMIPQQPINRVPDVKKIVEMKGNLNMTMSFGNFTVNSGVQEDQNNLRTQSKPTNKHSIMDDNAAFDRVLKAKKIFKIQKDSKPKSPTKQKMLKQQNINAGFSHQTIKLPITALRVCRGDFMGQNNLNHQEGEQMKPENAPLMNFLSAMQEKGYTNQQIMVEIQKFMNQNSGEHSSIQKI
jgi:hypothetical protein